MIMVNKAEIDSGHSRNGLEQRSNDPQLPTVGELERALGQRVSMFYRQLTGQQPQRVVCHFFANMVGILVEQSTTPVERLLINASQLDLANQVRICINGAVRQEMKALSESVLGIDVRAVLVDSVLGTGYTGVFVMLGRLPDVRNPGSIPKTDANRKSKKRRNGESDSASPSC